MERRVTVEMVGWSSILLALIAWFLIVVVSLGPSTTVGNDDAIILTVSFLLFAISSVAGLLSFQKWQGSIGLQISIVSVAFIFVAKLFLL